MNKQYEAYYAPGWAWFWLILAVIFTAGIVLFSILRSGVMIIAFSACVAAFCLMYLKTKKQTGIAVEIIDDILILHKKEAITVPLNEIRKIDIHDADGSFDLIIHCAGKKVSLHCFIQNQRQKKRALIDLLKNKGIYVSTYDLL